jgi:hypothetical protein
VTRLHSIRDGKAAANAMADVAPAKLRHLSFATPMHRLVTETAIRQIKV